MYVIEAIYLTAKFYWCRMYVIKTIYQTVWFYWYRLYVFNLFIKQSGFTSIVCTSLKLFIE